MAVHLIEVDFTPCSGNTGNRGHLGGAEKVVNECLQGGQVAGHRTLCSLARELRVVGVN